MRSDCCAEEYVRMSRGRPLSRYYLCSATPDIKSLLLDGTEDFVILACDGLWDVIPPWEVRSTLLILQCNQLYITQVQSYRRSKLKYAHY